MSRLTTYRVTFTSTSHIRIDIRATSKEQAIAKAERLYVDVDSDDPRFVCFGGDAFDCADAEEVVS
jgi:hypothetical protein